MKISSLNLGDWRSSECIACGAKHPNFFMEFGPNAWGAFCVECVKKIHSLTSPLSVLVCTGKNIEDQSIPN